MLVLKLHPGTQTSWNSAAWSSGVAVPIAPPSVPKETHTKRKRNLDTRLYTYTDRIPATRKYCTTETTDDIVSA